MRTLIWITVLILIDACLPENATNIMYMLLLALSGILCMIQDAKEISKK